MTGRDEPSVAVPILLCGILGGMVGGLNCCCWLVPGATSLLCVRWARNLRGDGGPVLRIGLLASLISALLVATWGTALFLYLNDPARMGESKAVVEGLLGGSGMEDLPLGMMALGLAGVGFVFALGVGLVGAAVGSIGNDKGRSPASAAVGAVGVSMSATRFLDPSRPPARAQAPVPAQSPVPAPLAPAALVAPEPSAPVPVAAPVEVPVAAPVEEPDAAEPDWSRFQRPAGQKEAESDLEVTSEELATREGEADAWED